MNVLLGNVKCTHWVDIILWVVYQVRFATAADTAFEAAAEAAFMTNMTLNPVFNPYANDVFFLHGMWPGP